jgi:RNA-directed DNA polymerase
VQFDDNRVTGKGMWKNIRHGVEGGIGEAALANEELQRIATQKQKQALETTYLMERVCDSDNLNKACKRVVANKGAAGIDKMEVSKLYEWLKLHRQTLIKDLLQDTFTPQPVKRVEVPKPCGGIRLLGIPTVIDRLVQQATLQILNPIIDPQFSEFSYGFRPGRSAHQALLKAQEYVKEERDTVVDIDLEKFFDSVNHDILMSRVARRISDKRILKLIRKFLQSGIMMDGVCILGDTGTPQGGPISPLLANILLDDLDKELEKRGHKFCRYADDCNIYVRTEKAGLRVMESITQFLEKKLKLKVNKTKSSVSPSSEAKVSRLPNHDSCHF